MGEDRKPVETLDRKECYYDKEKLSQTLKRQCAKSWRNFNRFLVDAKVHEALDSVVKYAISNPILLAVCLTVIVAVAIPILLFILFATVNVAFAFATFVVVQVTVLTIGATVLCCMLFCVISTITVIGLCVILTYYVAYYILSLLKSIKMVDA